ncbi:MAG: YggS family pyridoxal phosphate-dependent enzyme [Anaerolineae bacterium]
MNSLEANLRSVQGRIAAAARRAGRDPAEITLVAVTKTQLPPVIRAAYELGGRCFGENRVEEAEAKVPELPQEISWHMIGHVQSRKANRVAQIFEMVHSVDSVKLARRLDRACQGRPNPLPILLECNVSGEAAKYGFDAERWAENSTQQGALWSAVESIVALPNLQVRGLMTMAPIVADPEQARPVFVRLRQLRDGLASAFSQADWSELSMGMTDDFEVAVEEGATLVRVGRAIFAPDQPATCKI